MAQYDRFDKLYIAGKWRDGGSEHTNTVKDPYSRETITEIRLADQEDLNTAYRTAERSQRDWAEAPATARQAVMEKLLGIMVQRKEAIVNWLVRESGSTRLKAGFEWESACGIIRESAGFPLKMEGKTLPSIWPDKENRVYRKPVGVIGVISPWNFPLHLSMRSIAPALATGNAVVHKPASSTPITGGLLIARLLEEAGLPEGLFNVVVGKGSEIGDPFVTHPVPRVISFTGSTPVGKHIGELAGREIKRVSLELGGNNVFIVLDDADLDLATDAGLFGKFFHQGQICIAINRFLIHQDLYEAFLEKFVPKVKAIKAGNPAEADTVIGPLINQDQLEKVQGLVEDSVQQGAKTVLQGSVRGLLIEPIVLRDVGNNMPVAQNEVFGPVASLIAFKNDAEALEMANGTPYGLSGAVHSRDRDRAVDVAKQIRTGMVHINDQPVNDEPHAPFGGEKESGLGRFGGEWVLDELTTLQWISVQQKPRQYPF